MNKIVLKMVTAVGSLDTILLATAVKNSLKVSATFNLSKVVKPSTSKPIEIEPDFSLDEVSSDFSVFQRSVRNFYDLQFCYYKNVF